ncbi:MAG: hypothetical protein AAB391_00740 [Patescibacteria group bacterium]
MHAEEEKFERLKERVRLAYQNIGRVFCPFLQKVIVFNHVGFNHFFFKGNNRRRPISDSHQRLSIFRFVSRILNDSHTIQDMRVLNRFENMKSGSRRELQLSSVRYFEFVALMDGYRVKIVLKQIKDGPVCFLSVIPAWKRSFDSDDDPLAFT